MTRSRTWTLGTVLVVLVVFAVGWFLVISPKKATASDLRASAASTVSQNQGTEAKISELKLQQKSLPSEQAQIAAIQQQIPSQAQLPSLLRQFSNAADASDVNLSGISPGTISPVPQDTGVAYIPVVVTASGEFTQIKQFLFALEENKRAVLVTGFTIGKAQITAVAGQPAPDPNALAITIQTRVFLTTGASASTTAPSTTVTPTATPTAASTGAATAPASTPASAN